MKRKNIDVHAHIFPGKIRDKAVASIGHFYDIHMDAKGSPDDLLQQGSKIGTVAYVVHSVATLPRQVQHINDFISQQMQEHKEFIGYATLHPFMEDVEGEIERAIEMGLKGIKIHPDFQQFDIDDEAAMYMYEKLEGRLPVICHMGDEVKRYSAPKKLAKVIEAFPDLKIIAAHMGGYSEWEDAEKYVIGKNVWVDTSSTLFALAPEKVVDLIHKHGVDRVLFGTDYPMWRPDEELERFMKMDLTEEEREKILWKNAAEFLDLKIDEEE